MVGWMRDTFELDQPYKQTETKNASNREDFEDDIRLSMCDYENALTSNSRNKRNRDDPHGTHPLPI